MALIVNRVGGNGEAKWWWLYKHSAGTACSSQQITEISSFLRPALSLCRMIMTHACMYLCKTQIFIINKMSFQLLGL